MRDTRMCFTKITNTKNQRFVVAGIIITIGSVYFNNNDYDTKRRFLTLFF